jgi:hypothetical protein
MIKSLVKLEVTVADKYYQLFCDHDSPTTAVKVALEEFGKIVQQIEDNALQAQQAQKKDEEIIDVPVTEVEGK